MDVIIRHLGDVKFSATARGHEVICDQPVENSGTDTAMSPPEFLLVSLGTCAGYYAAQYLKTRNLPSEGLEVRVVAEKVTGPARLDGFKIEVKVPGVDAHHEAGLLRSVKHCLIHNTLLSPPSIEIAVETAVPAQV